MKKAFTILAVGIAIAAFITWNPFVSEAALNDNLEGCWTMDETSGTRADSTNNGNDLQDNNTVGSATGKVGNAADFEDDNDEYLSITDANQTGLDITGDMTVAFWWKAETAQNDERIVNKFDFTNSEQSYIYRTYTAQTDGTDLRARIGSTGGNTTATSLSATTWYHIAFVYDASAGEVEFFLDGSSEETVGGFPNSIPDTGAPFIMGTEFDNGAATSNSIDGLIDEVGVWSRALSASEISDLHNSGNGTSCDDLVVGAAGETTNSQWF